MIDAARRRYIIGDLIVIDPKRRFSITLRDGPGYAYTAIADIKPGNIGIIIELEPDTGLAVWAKILISFSGKKGWIPESALNRLTMNEK